MNLQVYDALKNWFKEPGAYVLVDGQYGSTGKGSIAAAIAECYYDRVDVAISNAGPNSGHTSYFGDEKIVLKQLPTFSVIAAKVTGREPVATFLSSGAVINRRLLEKEIMQHNMHRVSVHPTAAVIDEESVEQDHRNVYNIASTGQGVGPALERKLRRIPNAIYSDQTVQDMDWARGWEMHRRVCFLEVPQGFSLGINSGFYPHVTTRECTVSQALSDAGMPPNFHRKTIMAARTFPIRVGSTQNSSGPCYPDQRELSWEDIGVKPELTTVTGRVRRVFTWSTQQFKAALITNAPDVLFISFMDYLPDLERRRFIEHVKNTYKEVMGCQPEALLLSFGPRSSDLMVWK